MKIIAVTTLTNTQKNDIQQLENIVQEHDGIKKKTYLSNQFNDNKHMPSFFLAYYEQLLLGVLVVYADDISLAELTVFVHPHYRRKGIAQKLINTTHQTIKQYGITATQYVVEKVFMDNHKHMFKHCQFRVDESELLLEQQTMPKISYQQAVSVRLSTREDSHQLSTIHAKAFNVDIKLSQQYVEAVLNDDQIEQWVILYNHQLTGMLFIDTTTNIDFYFSVAIDPTYQQKGIGTIGLNKILHIRQSNKPQRLQVEVSNVNAIKLYQSNGFYEISEIRYVKMKENHPKF